MKRLKRLALSAEALAFLRERSEVIAGSPNPQAEAMRLWRQQANKAFREMRETLGKMASGLERCMYCEDSEGVAIEHFWPKAAYPERAFDWLNHLIACTRCNSNFKRDRFPLDGAGAPLLVNPADEEPLDHLSFSPSTGRFEARSPKGDPSIEIFGLNRTTLTKGRKNAWIALQLLVIGYAKHRVAGRDAEAEEIETIIRDYPFAGIFSALLRMASGPNADLLIDGECLRVIQSRPEIGTWT
jgi:uncharacterized protein (TIGR02646 family)